MNVSYRCWAEVDLGALRENLSWIRHQAGPQVRIMTVVKADAYGHGLKATASVLMQSGTDVFGVANLEEARTIRRIGQGWEILLLGAALPDEVDNIVRENVMPTISSLAEAHAFSAAAVRLRRTLRVQVKVDTGMGRLGVRPTEALALVESIASLPGIECHGLYTHYASVEDNPAMASEQRELFAGIVSGLRERSLLPSSIHANNSGGLLHEPASIHNLVRPGLLVYGVAPPGRRKGGTSLPGKLRPALSFYCRVGFLKEIHAGQAVGYGRTFVARRRMRVATITAGYGDGYLRAASNRASVLIGGRRCKVLGRVTMDQMVVDVSKVPEVKEGDTVVLIGQQGEESITASELARWCDTIPWEILTAITYRVPRVYRGGEAS